MAFHEVSRIVGTNYTPRSPTAENDPNGEGTLKTLSKGGNDINRAGAESAVIYTALS